MTTQITLSITIPERRRANGIKKNEIKGLSGFLYYSGLQLSFQCGELLQLSKFLFLLFFFVFCFCFGVGEGLGNDSGNMA